MTAAGSGKAPSQAPLTTTPAHGTRGPVVPFVVAVTGHRDVLAQEIPALRARVRDCLQRLRSDHPGRIVSVMSSLAAGADCLVAEVALELGLSLTVVLPMPRAMYERDFDTDASLHRFAALCAAATDIVELPVAAGQGDDADAAQWRSPQYAAVGVLLSEHCHVLIALWDGKDNNQLGGTAQVVRFHHGYVMPGHAPRVGGSRSRLAGDESDLVYHVVCSRDRPDGTPAPGLTATHAFWFTRDETMPRTPDLPERYRRAFDNAR